MLVLKMWWTLEMSGMMTGATTMVRIKAAAAAAAVVVVVVVVMAMQSSGGPSRLLSSGR
jgi:hypothetical protein